MRHENQDYLRCFFNIYDFGILNLKTSLHIQLKSLLSKILVENHLKAIPFICYFIYLVSYYYFIFETYMHVYVYMHCPLPPHSLKLEAI